MARRFNPAPGWPDAPAGWLPPAGWQPEPSWPPAPAGWQFVVDDSAPSTASTTALLVVSAFATISLFLTIPGIPALVLAIVAKTSARSHPDRARKLTKAGWIVFASLVALTVVATVIDYASDP
jgi:hypothetical protein